MRRSVTGSEDVRTARQSLHLKTFYKTFGKKGELKELSESTVHRKIMFPVIVQILCVKHLYRDVRPEKFQFLEKWKNRKFDYKIAISVKNP